MQRRSQQERAPVAVDAAARRRQIQALEGELREKEQELARLRRTAPPEPVEDHILRGRGGRPVSLSGLFGDQDDLIVIHNMGSRCPYCTLWADGFNGVVHHLEDRAAFVVVSPDPPDIQAAFASSRGWTFRMASDERSDFTRAVGFTLEHDGRTYYKPGASTFRRQPDGSLLRIANVRFGPGDVYCAPWHLFGMLADGVGTWEPRFRYERTKTPGTCG